MESIEVQTSVSGILAQGQARAGIGWTDHDQACVRREGISAAAVTLCVAPTIPMMHGSFNSVATFWMALCKSAFSNVRRDLLIRFHDQGVAAEDMMLRTANRTASSSDLPHAPPAFGSALLVGNSVARQSVPPVGRDCSPATPVGNKEASQKNPYYDRSEPSRGQDSAHARRQKRQEPPIR